MMSHAHQVPALDARDAAQAAEEIRARGMRLTAARRHLIEALFAAEGPVSVEEIAAGLDGRVPSFDQASIYRNLERFESIGLVRHVHLGHGPGLYTLASEPAPGYLVCDGCGARRAVKPEQLQPVHEAIQDGLDFDASFSHFPIVGLCSSCARSR